MEIKVSPPFTYQKPRKEIVVEVSEDNGTLEALKAQLIPGTRITPEAEEMLRNARALVPGKYKLTVRDPRPDFVSLWDVQKPGNRPWPENATSPSALGFLLLKSDQIGLSDTEINALEFERLIFWSEPAWEAGEYCLRTYRMLCVDTKKMFATPPPPAIAGKVGIPITFASPGNLITTLEISTTQTRTSKGGNIVTVDEPPEKSPFVCLTRC